MDFEKEITNELIELALKEDRIKNDVTTNALIEYDRTVLAKVSAKEDGVISGIDVFIKVLYKVDKNLNVIVSKEDGDSVNVGDIVLEIRGYESSILKAERTALNFLQRLSGVASVTRRYVEALKGTSVKLLDTRKTTPGMRYPEKKAVLDGGGNNHRMNLEDMVMIKDNHILMAGSIGKAVEKIIKFSPDKRIEVEVKNIKEFEEAVSLDVDIIMLDNFDELTLQKVLMINRNDIKIEISGNITLDNISTRAKHGVDFISVGALTHSYKSLDLSLNVL
jgi:nicotinate-nucleotide pyrophosphorylase (carboxylating)